MMHELKKILEKFYIRNIEYCLLKNYDEAFKRKEFLEKDLDILVSRKNIEKINEIFKEEGFFFKKSSKFEEVKSYKKYVRKHGRILCFGVHLDNLSYHNIPYIYGNEVLKRRIKKSFFFSPSNEDLLLILLLHPILSKGFFTSAKYKPTHIAGIKSLLNDIKDKNYIYDQLSRVFGHKTAKEIQKLLFSGNFKKLERKKNLLLLLILIRNFSKFPYIVWDIIKKRMKRFIPYQNGQVIAFLGIDGSGKTTITKELKKELELLGEKVEIVYMGKWRNRILPISRISAIKKNNSKELPIRKKKLYELFKNIILVLDMLLRYIIKIYPKKKKGYYILTDRYAYDLLLYHRSSLMKFLLRFFPKPDKIFYLHNHPKILLLRKQQHDLDEIKRQLYLYKKINKELNLKAIEIKTDEIEDTLNIIFKNLID